jgi:hypothetical protein
MMVEQNIAGKAPKIEALYQLDDPSIPASPVFSWTNRETPGNYR